MDEASEYENRIAELVTSADPDIRAQGIELAVSLGSPTVRLHQIAEAARAEWRAASAREAALTVKEARKPSTSERLRIRAEEVEAYTRAEAAEEALRSYLREAQEVSHDA